MLSFRKSKVLLFSILFFIISSVNFVLLGLNGTPCKDCGSFYNCENSNGLNSGYQTCSITYINNIPYCNVSGWGNCGTN